MARPWEAWEAGRVVVRGVREGVGRRERRRRGRGEGGKRGGGMVAGLSLMEVVVLVRGMEVASVPQTCH